jgi:hypothetical protein
MIKISAIAVFAIVAAHYAAGCEIQLEKGDMCVKLGEKIWGDHNLRCVTFIGATLNLQCTAEENVQVRDKIPVPHPRQKLC